MPDKNVESQGSQLSHEATSALSDAAARVQSTAAEYGQKAVDALDSGRTTAARGLDAAAAGMHANADRLPGAKVHEVAHQAADALEGAADYVREHGTTDVMADIQTFVKSHPAEALVGAAVMGFFVGRLFNRD